MASRSSRASDPLRQLSTVDALAQLSFRIQGLLERRAAGLRTSIIQTRLLGVLRDRNPTMQELSKLLGLDKSSVTGLVDRAQRRGLVVRLPSTVDRRVVLVALTKAGEALVAEVAAGFEIEIEALLGRLPASDRSALSEIASRVLVADADAHGIDLFDTLATDLN